MATDENKTAVDRRAACLSFLKDNILIMSVLVGVMIGVCLGFGLRAAQPSEDSLMWLGLPGEIFMRLLKVTILPIIVSSIISGTASVGPKSNGRIGVVTVGFIAVMNTVGSFLGIIMFFIFRPGHDTFVGNQQGKQITTHLQTQDMFADLIRNIFPENFVTSAFEKTQTTYTSVEHIISSNSSNVTEVVVTRSVQTAAGTNILGVIFLSTVIGMAAGKVGQPAKPFVVFFEATTGIFIYILKWFIWSTPIGVASLVASSIARVDDLERTFQSLGIFILAFTIGSFVQQMIIVPVIFFIVARQNPFKFLINAMRPMMSTFGPPSSAIGIPDAIQVAENKYDIDKRISRFVIPFGAQECRYGSALFVAMSVMFLSSIGGTRTEVVQVVVVGFLTAVSSFAIPSVPSGSLVTILIVLSSIGVSGENVGLLMAIEWYTDRVRSSSNTLVALLCTFVTQRFCKLEDDKHLKVQDNGYKDDIDIAEMRECML